MAAMVDFNPARTPIADEVTTHLDFNSFNFAKDWRPVEEGPGKIIYTNIAAEADRPCTIRVQQTARPNVYAGTSVEPGNMAATKRGCDTVVEYKGVAAITDDSDSTFRQLYPFRVALTMNLPVSLFFGSSSDVLANVITPLIQAIADGSGSATSLADGITPLLHGVVEKR